jgi:serine/threonine protein kinase
MFAVKIFGDKCAWRRELNSLTFLAHKNIVRIYCIVYETLEDKIQMHPPLGYAMELMARSAATWSNYSHQQLISVFEQVASALAFAHENDVIHFDVKPDNILLDESCTVAKLCDFGWAHKLEAASESAKSGGLSKFRGTLHYMAPEAFEPNFKTSPHAKLCDVYSFGKTMWKLLHPSLTVVPNYVAEFIAEMQPALMPLKELVEQCTNKDPSHRPPKMYDVWERLQELNKTAWYLGAGH